MQQYLKMLFPCHLIQMTLVIWPSSISNLRPTLTAHYGSSFIVSHLLPGGIQVSGSRKNMRYLSPNIFQKNHKDQLGKPYLSAEAAMTDSHCQRWLWHSHSQISRLQLSLTLASIVKTHEREWGQLHQRWYNVQEFLNYSINKRKASYMILDQK